MTDDIKAKSVFTRNRIKDIKLFKENLFKSYHIKVTYKYVTSDDNPSDMLSRGLTFKEFEKKMDFWCKGPSWLSCVPLAWPNKSLDCLSNDNKHQVNLNYFTDTLGAVEPVKDPIMDIHKFSTLNKLLGSTKCVFQFLNNLRNIDNDPMEDSKMYWIKYMQSSKFAECIQYLSNQNKGQRKVPELVDRLDLFLDNSNILRSRGRIGKTAVYDYEVVNPVLLAKDHHLTTLIVDYYHSKCKHLGIQSTISAVRMGGFWIPRMRQSIKRIISQCMTCRKFNALSFKYPKMTNLPKHRVNLVKPYNHTGVDFTGHLWVKDETGKNIKMYLLIFTCLNIRSVHVEIVPDMTTHSFVLAFLRFVNLYGVPSTLYSDNAKTFIAGGNILEEVMITDEFNSQFQNFNIKHIRIPAYSAWVGSTWERLIRTIKNCLYKTVGRARLTYFELLTVIGDIQSAVNSRPLTYRSSDNDLESITPNSFLRFNANPFLLLRQSDENRLWETDPPSRETLVKSLELRNEIFEHFRELWYESYLLSLRENYRELHESHWVNRMKAGDVVLVKLPNKPRPYWLLGRIVELIIGFDNKIRSVKVMRGDGQVAHHSINHLYPLELSLTHAHNDSHVEGNEVDENLVIEDGAENRDTSVDRLPSGIPNDPASPVEVALSENSSARPKRTAAKACEEKMRKWCHTLRD